MKNLINSLVILIFIFSVSMQAQNRTIEEAIKKGKSDLIEVLSKTGEELNFGIDAEAVKRSKPASPLSLYQVNFEKLLNYEPGNEDLEVNTRKTIVPLVTRNKVVSTISVSNKEGNMYEVSELINHNYQNELNQLPERIQNQDFKNLKIIYVPNLNTYIYTDSDGNSYTSYKGGSLKEPIPTEELYLMLQEDAKVFQKKYGHLLKEKKLLN